MAPERAEAKVERDVALVLPAGLATPDTWIWAVEEEEGRVVGTVFVGVRETIGRDPLVYAHGPARIERVAICSGGAGGELIRAAHEGYDLFLTGEPEEPSLQNARELGIHFVAAGHDATERLGVQALSRRLAERFELDWEFIPVENPV